VCRGAGAMAPGRRLGAPASGNLAVWRSEEGIALLLFERYEKCR
jgi:hypothetical protein